jgi:GrpB-like predicted nucleotidyltransferase (UPF0157 family)
LSGEAGALAALGDPTPVHGRIELSPYDPAWPAIFEGEAAKVRAALGEAAMEIHHAGSTSIPDLVAKPIVDMVLAVADSADEASYVAALAGAGFALRIREPDWFEHRLLRGAAPAVNLHVFSAGSPEIARMLAFRDRLRTDEADRRLYEAAKRDLAARQWPFVQDYADAKTTVVEAILARAMAETT